MPKETISLDLLVKCLDPEVILKFDVTLMNNNIILKKEKFELGRTEYVIKYLFDSPKTVEKIRVKIYYDRTEEISTFDTNFFIDTNSKLKIFIDHYDDYRIWLSFNNDKIDENKIKPNTVKTRWKFSRILC